MGICGYPFGEFSLSLGLTSSLIFYFLQKKMRRCVPSCRFVHLLRRKMRLRARNHSKVFYCSRGAWDQVFNALHNGQRFCSFILPVRLILFEDDVLIIIFLQMVKIGEYCRMSYVELLCSFYLWPASSRIRFDPVHLCVDELSTFLL
jgi:hypothetical protein